MASRLGDVRVVVVAPSYEAPVTISRIQNEFPRLVIDRDVDKVWRAHEASNHDQIVFDRYKQVQSPGPVLPASDNRRVRAGLTVSERDFFSFFFFAFFSAFSFVLI
ncbi:hypothetical protein Y032_0149g2710 [Ancylostoma ceylanicum]|uniref:Uncharacterized protein n=1 Tax=Ancylostoma ceylanicum TaxID=53326 RepID=A0A016T1Y8_9BILA|nr:hypothetical protein Y032_0149g2710 [Ancylostoma ceylanicum]